MSNVTHEQAKKPDAVTEQLKRGFEWTTTHSSIAIGASAIFLAVLGGYFGLQSWSLHKEEKLQGELFNIEREYLEKKEAFDQAQAVPPNADPKAEAPKAPAKASGNISKDYADIPQKLTAFVDRNVGTTAGGMAALYASEVFMTYKQPETAIAVLQKANLSKGLVGSLTQNRLASLLADKNDCAAALGIWTQMMKSTDNAFLSAEIKLRMGLCAESTGDKAQAEKLYQEVAAAAKDGGNGKLAEQLLRLMKVKTN